MDEIFKRFDRAGQLTGAAAEALDRDGYVVIDGPVPDDKLEGLAEAYDRAVREASQPDIAVGRTTTRVHDLVNRGPQFDNVYIHPPVLAACCRVIKASFGLSSVLARTLHAGAGAQALHVDVPPDARGWPMIGFVLMIDEFRVDNGATRFVPGSHVQPPPAARACAESEAVAACGPAGAVIVYNGCVLHGHGANHTKRPRRSIQGAYVRRDIQPALNWTVRMLPETLERLGPVAKNLLFR